MIAAHKSHQYLLSPTLRRLGYWTWAAMAVLALIFFQERATFMDGGFQLTELINTEQFGIYHHRLTNPLTQIFPYLAIKISLPLKAVMIAYSLNFIAFFALIYHIIVRWTGNDYLAWTQIFFFTLFSTDTFFFLTPEFYQGMSLLLLWFAAYLKFDFKHNNWLFSFLFLILIPIVFDHLLLAAFFLFLWIFFWLKNPKQCLEYYFLLAGMFFFFWLRGTYFTSWYDTMKKKDFWLNFDKYSPSFWELPAWDVFAAKCFNLYYWFPILCVFVILTGILKTIKSISGKEKLLSALRLLLVLGFILTYLLVVHIGDPQTPYIFYAEVNYLGLIIPLAVYLFFELHPEPVKSHLLPGIFLLVVISRLVTITLTAEKFKERQRWISSQFEATESDKLILQGKENAQSIYIQDWSLPEESLLLTALQHPDSTKTFLIPTEEKQYLPYLNHTDLWLEKGRRVPISEMKQDYFRLGNNPYEVIEE